jgi:hypothetical protein
VKSAWLDGEIVSLRPDGFDAVLLGLQLVYASAKRLPGEAAE